MNLYYRCPECSAEWHDTWSCACDADCPGCGCNDVSPFEADDLDGWTEESEQQEDNMGDDGFLPYPSSAVTLHYHCRDCGYNWHVTMISFSGNDIKYDGTRPDTCADCGCSVYPEGSAFRDPIVAGRVLDRRPLCIT